MLVCQHDAQRDGFAGFVLSAEMNPTRGTGPETCTEPRLADAGEIGYTIVVVLFYLHRSVTQFFICSNFHSPFEAAITISYFSS